VRFELILPRLEYEPSYGAYIRELGDEERYPFPLDFEHGDFAALLMRLDDLATGTNLSILKCRSRAQLKSFRDTMSLPAPTSRCSRTDMDKAPTARPYRPPAERGL
jgi:hypothetical protein